MKKIVTLLLALALAQTCFAQPSNCPQHFYLGQAPELANPKLAAKTRELCFSAYAVLHSGISRTPLWSAEHLSAAQLAESKSMKRQNAFHAEPRLPTDEAAQLHDYARSGYDRGHMSPSGDMPDPQSQHESFSLANMVPQDANNNQHLWAALEEATRNLARQRGQLYVVTGPLFEGDALARLNGRVLVPSGIFKAIFDPTSGGAAAYLAPNRPGMDYRVISIAELEQRSGLHLFPALPAAARQQAMRLPEPALRGRKY